MTDVLREWKDSDSRKALCIFGAREVGKSTVVREFAKENYEVFVEVDFTVSRQNCEIFSKAKSPDEIFLSIEAISPSALIPHKTLILLAEIQECPEARTVIKYLVQDGRFDYIETGSLLGVKIDQVRSYPVGFERVVEMYPLDFEEFMWAMDIPDSTFTTLKICYKNKKPVEAHLHKQLLDLFHTYLAVGGMPEAVADYVQNRSLSSVQTIQERIVNSYRLDLMKYTSIAERIKIQNIFESVSVQLNEKSPRFFMTKVYPKARMNLYESSLDWTG